ncbi:MAG: hypothetical protein KI790_03065 [Cyclobacteriaceae bacterium]|nr:hypothetical protein [Cyclobacteriaceae bacterium HetDA_MAG_MS6]
MQRLSFIIFVFLVLTGCGSKYLQELEVERLELLSQVEYNQNLLEAIEAEVGVLRKERNRQRTLESETNDELERTKKESL